MRYWLAFALFAAPFYGMATTITVNSTDDTVANDGHCTLREAIVAANNNVASGSMPGECAAGQAAPVVDTIAFNIAGAGVHTITPATSFPQFIEVVKVDGYSQPGASANTLSVGDNAVLLIAFDAKNLSDTVFAFHGGLFGGGDSGGSLARGLEFHHIDHGSAFAIGTGFGNGVSNIALQGNFAGLGADDTSFTSPISCVSSSGLLLGGATPAARNVLAAKGSNIVLLNQCTHAVVQGNYVGISADGKSGIASPVADIELAQGSDDALIGGAGVGEGNVFSSSSNAISIHNGCDGIVIQGNRIGTDAAGTSSIGNTFGISLDGASNTLIGGSGQGEGNVIAGNSVGIVLNANTATRIQGNSFGIGADGGGLPNRSTGIEVAGSTSGLIGGTAPGEGNVIANSCVKGISIQNGAQQWSILGNSIHGSGTLGISLNGDAGPSTNDPGDGDAGNNGLQNYPVLTSATLTADVATISGTLNSQAGKSYRLEFFSGVECNRSGFGEGTTFLGFSTVATDGTGNVSFGPLTFTGAPNNQTAFSATATDPDGNTSEFSMCLGGVEHVFEDNFEPHCS